MQFLIMFKLLWLTPRDWLFVKPSFTWLGIRTLPRRNSNLLIFRSSPSLTTVLLSITHSARTFSVVVKTVDFGAADPSSNPLREGKFGSLFRAIWRVWTSGVTHKACWEVASPVIPCVWEAKGHVVECDSEGVCTHRCFTGKNKQKTK